MAIVNISDMLDFLGNPSAEDAGFAEQIQESVEKWIQRECRRTFETTTYLLERYNGTGSRYLYLRNYPVTNVLMIAIGNRDAIKICNTNAGTTASASVTSSSVILTRDNVTDSTLAFATYTTITTLVAAINAVGSGWTASVLDSSYGSYKSNFLIPRFGNNCINSNWVYLRIPEKPEDEFEVYENRGTVALMRSYSSATETECVFPKGNNNIYVSYTAGYTEDDMPDDLQLAIKIFVKDIYQKKKDSSWNLKSFTIGPISYTYADNNYNIPMETQNYLQYFKRKMI